MTKKDASLESSVARLRNRVAVPKYYYDTLPKDLRALAFYISDLEKLRQIEMIKRSLDNAIKRGDSFQTWRDNLDIDTLNSLSKARLETVYRTNVNTVYNQSTRFNALSSDVTPYLMYTAVGDERTRPEHMRLDGTIKRADSEFWDKYTPPLGFNCRCGTIPLSKSDADDIGISKRSNKSFPEPESGFGKKSYGDVLSSVQKEAEDAISKIKDKELRAKFKEAQDNIKNLVDIWFTKNKDIIE